MAIEISSLVGYLIPLLIVVLVLTIVIAILRNLKTIAVIGMGLLIVSFLGANLAKDKSELINNIRIDGAINNGVVNGTGPIEKASENIYIGFDAGDEFTAMDVEVELYNLNKSPELLDRKDTITVGKKYVLFSFQNKGYEAGNYKFVIKADGKAVKEQAFKIV
ncbi:hypothetical protein HYT84_01840 [Candidatus Micrarchaeota archaeon]|nr:hypothetical protein [Candidatus Micrarchaeota archaeon]